MCGNLEVSQRNVSECGCVCMEITCVVSVESKDSEEMLFSNCAGAGIEINVGWFRWQNREDIEVY